MALLDLIQFGIQALEKLGINLGDVDNILDALVHDSGQQGADAVVKKFYLQAPDRYKGDPSEVGKDGKTNIQRLAQDGFLEFRHYLRAGNASYPGAPDIPQLQTGADAIYDVGAFRTQIHNWCNTAAKNLLASPPATS